MSQFRKKQLILSIYGESIINYLLDIIPTELLFIILIDYNNEILFKNTNVKYMNEAFIYIKAYIPGYYPLKRNNQSILLRILCSDRLPKGIAKYKENGFYRESVCINWNSILSQTRFEIIENMRVPNTKVGIIIYTYVLIRKLNIIKKLRSKLGIDNIDKDKSVKSIMIREYYNQIEERLGIDKLGDICRKNNKRREEIGEKILKINRERNERNERMEI
jgi:hypothetical protein